MRAMVPTVDDTNGCSKRLIDFGERWPAVKVSKVADKA